ncbi:unnamed protein product [Schistosoma margrebowiei]|uniref:Uncharacterized protein n=1 Tax=Schistosoma margrebowiei TaxID=48269 RepID=A0A183MKG9_9TREM|nr:unnamed protein product [Schistosoma margrebowiei]
MPLLTTRATIHLGINLHIRDIILEVIGRNGSCSMNVFINLPIRLQIPHTERKKQTIMIIHLIEEEEEEEEEFLYKK